MSTLTAATISEFSRKQVWDYIASNDLPVKKLSSTIDARQALIDFLESQVEAEIEPDYEFVESVTTIEIEQDYSTETAADTLDDEVTEAIDDEYLEADDTIDDEPELQDACDNDNDPEDDTLEPPSAIMHVESVEPEPVVEIVAIDFDDLEPDEEPATATELMNTISISALYLSKLTDVSKFAKVKHLTLAHEAGLLTAIAVRGGITVIDRVTVVNSNGSWATCLDDTFINFTKKLKSSEFVSLDTTDPQQLKVIGDRGRLDVSISGIDLTPEPNRFAGKVVTSFTCGAESLLKAVKNAAPCRSTEHPVLRSVLVKIDGSIANLIATDGSRLAVARTELLASSGDRKSTILIPDGMVDALAAMSGSIAGGVKLTIDSSKTHMRVSLSDSSLELVSFKPEDCFTNVDPVIQQVKEAEAVCLTFDTATVRDRLSMLAPIANKAMASTVILTLDSTGHAHILAGNENHTADTGFEYTGTAIDRVFEFNYGFFMYGLSTGNESIELSCPVNVPLVKLSTPTFAYYLAPIN